MDLMEQFNQAAEDSKSLAQRPSNETMLQLYSLYKQATAGDAGEVSLAPFDFVARAKYDAWVALKGKSKEMAMQDYISLVGKLKN